MDSTDVIRDSSMNNLDNLVIGKRFRVLETSRRVTIPTAQIALRKDGYSQMPIRNDHRIHVNTP
jgi:hypothetical protein